MRTALLRRGGQRAGRAVMVYHMGGRCSRGGERHCRASAVGQIAVLGENQVHERGATGSCERRSATEKKKCDLTMHLARKGVTYFKKGAAD